MIRRDYILRMIQQFFEALSRINAFKKAQQWKQASAALEEQFQRLAGEEPEKILAMSETELLARLMQDEPSLAVREKTYMMATLLKTAGDVALAQNKTSEGSACHLKGLHLLLGLMAQEEAADARRFVPAIEEFVLALDGTELPAETQALLMQHYERGGEYAKAEDALFRLLEAWPLNTNLLDFGIAFYERLLRHGDAQLNAGNLPRVELEAGLADLRRQKSSIGDPATNR